MRSRTGDFCATPCTSVPAGTIKRRSFQASSITRPMIGVSMLVESPVFTSSQRKQPAIRQKPFADGLFPRCENGLPGWVAAALEWGVARTTLSDSRADGVAWVRDSGLMSSSKE